MKLWQKIFLTLAALSLSLPLHATEWPAPKAGMQIDALRAWQIQEGGRKKPLDTFARESVRSLTGREKFRGFDPIELLLSWLTESKTWEDLPFIEVGFAPLQKQLQLDLTEGRVSPAQLRNNSNFTLFLQGVMTKQQEGSKLSELEKSGLALMQRLTKFGAIASGDAFTLVPRKGEAWDSLGALARRYPSLDSLQADPSPDSKIAAGVQALLASYHDGDGKMFSQVALLMTDTLNKQGERVGDYASAKQISREIHFNQLKPFRWAWVGYSLAFFLLLSSLWLHGVRLYRVGLVVLAGTFCLHAYGIVLRCLISGRAPVTNMYETVIWVSLGIVFFSLVFEAIYRARYYGVAAAALATLCLILADSAPNILDPAINPLVPVLRNNYWLTVHVLTITLSYAAFALALGVGNVSIGYYLFKPEASEKIKNLNYFLYRSMQVGVVLLAAGTILGGVWANASWGRFWGWDPKEVWALIALLGYLSILHGRYAGWLRGFGLAVGSILAFLLVIMSWYGVNFILGVGLHSYGFSSGGAKFVCGFVGLELLWIIFATIRYKVLFPSAGGLKEGSV